MSKNASEEHDSLGVSDELGRYAAASRLLNALSAPRRLAIIELLAAGPHCVHEIAAALTWPQPLLSQHLRVLRQARLVTTTRRGREVVYQLTDAHVAAIVTAAIEHTTE